jgi:hypothetical protein
LLLLRCQRRTVIGLLGGADSAISYYAHPVSPVSLL